jgi:hypothetical protein
MFTHRATTAGAVLLIGLIAGQSARADKTETFDSAASAAANGWTVTGSGGGGGTAGWIDSNDAGGAAAGEAQYDVTRGPDLNYLDTNLGMSLNGNVPFHMEGTFTYTKIVDPDDPEMFIRPDVGVPPNLGFSSSGFDYLGIMFRSDDEMGSDLEFDLAWGLRWETAGEGIRTSMGGDASRIMTSGVPRTFSVAYDPNDGEFGSITASVSDAGGPLTFFLNQINREVVLNNAALTRAGLVKRVSNEGNSGFNLRLDDITYTGVASTVDVLPGDYNNDLVVDAADYTVWRDNLGAGDESSLNGNGDGMNGVDAGDYSLWKDHFGDIPPGAGGLAGGSLVPEPASWLLATLVGVAIGSLGRRNR